MNTDRSFAAFTRVLLVEDSSSDARLLARALRDDPLGATFAVTIVATLGEAVGRLSREPFDVVLLDLNLPDSSALETLDRIQEQVEGVPVVVLTSMGGEELAMSAVARGAQDFLFKDRLDPYWISRAVTHAIGRFQLTRRLRAAEARENEAARAANAAHAAFLTNLSHEIRTPLGSIAMAADLAALEAAREPGLTELLDTIGRNAAHLGVLVDDVLDRAKIEAGQLRVERVPTPVRAPIQDAVSMIAPKASAKGLLLTADFDPRVPEVILTDPTRLRQILLNLLGNAVKFTMRGRISVRVTPEGEERLLVDVSDTGEGMTETQRQRLFQPFAQADDAVARTHGGTGLGLCLSRELARLLGGDLEIAATRPGAGSTFRVTLDGAMHP